MQRYVTKIVGFLFLTALTSCLTDYQGQIPEKTEFTATNYVYEGDLYKFYLEQQIENAENNGNNNQLNFWKKELSNIINLQEIGLDIIGPRPPCPRPRDCGYEELKYLLIDSKTEKVEVLFYDGNDKLVGGGSIDKLSPLPDSKGLIYFANLQIEDYTNVNAIKIEVFADNKVVRSYLVK